MPAPTVVSGSAVIMGAVNKDGSFFVRSTLQISDGSTQNYDRPNVPAGEDYAGADLTALIANVNAQLAVVPSPISSPAARSVIYSMGLHTQVEAAVAEGSATVQQLWYTAATIDRNDPNLIAIGTALGLTSDQIDDMFRAAAALG
jgi:hypothetical protein